MDEKAMTAARKIVRLIREQETRDIREDFRRIDEGIRNLAEKLDKLQRRTEGK